MTFEEEEKRLVKEIDEKHEQWRKAGDKKKLPDISAVVNLWKTHAMYMMKEGNQLEASKTLHILRFIFISTLSL